MARGINRADESRESRERQHGYERRADRDRHHGRPLVQQPLQNEDEGRREQRGRQHCEPRRAQSRPCTSTARGELHHRRVQRRCAPNDVGQEVQRVVPACVAVVVRVRREDLVRDQQERETRRQHPICGGSPRRRQQEDRESREEHDVHARIRGVDTQPAIGAVHEPRHEEDPLDDAERGGEDRGVDHSGLREVALVPVEGGRRDRDARAGPDAPVTVDAGSQRHRWDPLTMSLAVGIQCVVRTFHRLWPRSRGVGRYRGSR